MEVIGSQVMTFVSGFIPVQFMNNGVDLFLDVGATEPLLKLDGQTTASSGSSTTS
jgi:hypothetical protein